MKNSSMCFLSKIYSQTNLELGQLPSPFMRTCTCIANSLIITFSFGEMKVFYKKEVGAGTAVKETPEIERVKKNQQNISSVSVININYSYVSKWWSIFFPSCILKILCFYITHLIQILLHWILGIELHSHRVRAPL